MVLSIFVIFYDHSTIWVKNMFDTYIFTIDSYLQVLILESSCIVSFIRIHGRI